METDYTAHRLAVIGAGVMGTNISTLALGHGVPVTLVDLDDARLGQARTLIKQKLRHAQLMGALPDRPQAELTTTTSLTDIADATSVVEAVVEIAETKYKVLSEASALVRPGTTLISNTSCISIDEMAAHVARPEELAAALHEPLVHDQDGRGDPRHRHQRRRAGERQRAADRAGPRVAGDQRLDRLRHQPAAAPADQHRRDARPGRRRLGRGRGRPARRLPRPTSSTGPLRTGDLIGLDTLFSTPSRSSTSAAATRAASPATSSWRRSATDTTAGKTGRGFYDYGKVAQ